MTIVGVMSSPLSSFATFLRTRQTEILEDWRRAAGARRAGWAGDSSGRMDGVRAWLGYLMALAKHRRASAGGILAVARQHGTTLADLSLLHRLIERRARVEQGAWSLDESELLWGAFDTAVAEFARDDARLYAEAQQALRAREEMLAIVTHDLRTPLSAVTAGASLLISKDAAAPDPVRITRRGEMIRRAARHMARLLDDLTSLAQIEAGRLAIDKTLESPADVVKEVAEALEAVVTRGGGVLHTAVAADAPRVPLDRGRVRQVVSNLIGNAAKVGASKISVGAEPRGAEVVFWVADNGPGIRPEDVPRMFDRYFRRPGTEYKGSGLGLPISNDIVKAHGGRMWVESTPGSGSTFYFSIPR